MQRVAVRGRAAGRGTAIAVALAICTREEVSTSSGWRLCAFTCLRCVVVHASWVIAIGISAICGVVIPTSPVLAIIVPSSLVVSMLSAAADAPSCLELLSHAFSWILVWVE